jgi:lactoylglutathione lyase
VTTHFVFTKLIVDDLDTQATFYATVFGQVVKHRFSGGEGDGAFEEIVMGPVSGEAPSLLLVRYDRKAPEPGEAVLGFAVADVDEAVRAALAAGGVVRSEPKSLPQQGVRVAEIADPERHRLELVQYL